MSERVYPDQVQKQRTTGTAVKKVGNNYYLYKHSSKRVRRKKNPVPVDTYIGKITTEGIEKSGLKKVVVNEAEAIVKEYGVDFKELRQLSSIYMVIVSGKKLVSKISEGQKKLLERLELKLEVDQGRLLYPPAH